MMGESSREIPSLPQSELQELSLGNFENVSYHFSDWQKSHLENISYIGIECLVYMWFTIQPKLVEGTFCNATWDSFYCWPPTPAGMNVSRPCSQILEASYQTSVAQHIKGQAIRVCLENATWLFGSWTDYDACADSIEDYEKRSAKEYEEERDLVVHARYILFFGSILSFVCLVASLFLFYYFKCLRCDRVTVHVHLMLALTLRSILLVVITEPFIFQRTHHYRNVDSLCKTVVSLNLYATVASIHWMFLQGVYLHGKLTTNVFDKGTPFRIYFAVGWGLPLVLICGWAAVMEIHHPKECWKDYGDLPYIWMLLGPMICALVINLLFLINIMRILLTKIQLACVSGDAAQFRRAVKATVLLFPLLGITNLLLVYNPGGHYKRTFVILNTFFQSTQGVFVSVLYCFLSTDVKDAVRRKYRRFAARRSANSIRRSAKNKRSCRSNNGAVTGLGGEQRVFIAPTHFRSKFKASEASHSRSQQSPSPETVNNILPSPSPSPPSVHSGNEDCTSSRIGCGGGTKRDNQYQVNLPLREFNHVPKKN